MILNEYGKIAHDEWKKSFEIRSEIQLDEFERIKQYIINNPKNWENDRNNKEGLWI